jgi:hypothetical protein
VKELVENGSADIHVAWEIVLSSGLRVWWSYVEILLKIRHVSNPAR